MHSLLATDSVHTTAAICDVLEDRVASTDRATVCSVVSPPETTDRDAEDACNVASVRLAGLASVETVVEDGEPAETVLEAAESLDVDEIVIGPRRGDPDATAAVGTAARRIVAEASVPVVVVPIPGF